MFPVERPAAQERDSDVEQITTLPGVVRGLGPESATAAELYARLTGRPHRQYQSLDELKTSCHDVVICSTAYLSTQLMHKLYIEGDTAGVPGLICAPNGKELEEVCYRQAARFAQKPPTRPKRVFLHSGLFFDTVERGTDVMLSGMDHDRVLTEVSSGASVLAICAHSGGHAFPLTARTFACSFVASPARDDKFGIPCQESGKCDKFPSMPTIAEAQEKGWIVPLTTIRAEVAILYVCCVIRVRDGTVDPGHALAAALLRQAEFGVLITTWRPEIFGGLAYLNGLVNDICAGTMAGIAVRSFNNSAAGKRYSVKLCVIGDPCFVIAPNSAFEMLREGRIEPTSADAFKLKGEWSESSEIALLRDAAVAAPQNYSRYCGAKPDALVAALSAYTNLTNPTPGRDGMQDISGALLELLRTAPRLDKFFDSFCVIGEIKEDETCPGCLAPARSFRMAFPKYGAKSRKVIRCAACDEISNMPAGWDVRLDMSRLHEGEVSLSGVPPGAQIHVSLMTFVGALYESFAVPILDDNRAVFSLPEQLPPMIINGWIIIVRRVEVACLGFRLRKFSDGSISTPRSI
jgi:hypothetical protein